MARHGVQRGLSVPREETFQGKMVWESVIQVFEFAGDPNTARVSAENPKNQLRAMS